MAWTLTVARAAQKQLARLPAKERNKVTSVLLAMANDPFSGDVLKLAGMENHWRRRVGNHRIFFAVETRPRMVKVSAIVRRTSTTYR